MLRHWPCNTPSVAGSAGTQLCKFFGENLQLNNQSFHHSNAYRIHWRRVHCLKCLSNSDPNRLSLLVGIRVLTFTLGIFLLHYPATIGSCLVTSRHFRFHINSHTPVSLPSTVGFSLIGWKGIPMCIGPGRMPNPPPCGWVVDGDWVVLGSVPLLSSSTSTVGLGVTVTVWRDHEPSVPSNTGDEGAAVSQTTSVVSINSPWYEGTRKVVGLSEGVEDDDNGDERLVCSDDWNPAAAEDCWEVGSVKKKLPWQRVFLFQSSVCKHHCHGESMLTRDRKAKRERPK